MKELLMEYLETQDWKMYDYNDNDWLAQLFVCVTDFNRMAGTVFDSEEMVNEFLKRGE